MINYNTALIALSNLSRQLDAYAQEAYEADDAEAMAGIWRAQDAITAASAELVKLDNAALAAGNGPAPDLLAGFREG